MGIKHLNRYFIENCSKRAMHVETLKQFTYKTIAIDASIYMYKFTSRNALLENMYLMISILLENKITPIFVFDGKPPPEKRELLFQRSRSKKEAEMKYNQMKSELENTDMPAFQKKELQVEMDILKEQFIRIKDSDVKKIKSLLSAFGVCYYDAKGEADRLCAYLVKTGIAWACLSDDMDMFLYGCPRVLRHISLLKHTVVLYELTKMLEEMKISMTDFKTMAILSGTDYNIHDSISLYDSAILYDEYCAESPHGHITFQEWLVLEKDISEETLHDLHRMFSVSETDDFEKYVNKESNSRYDLNAIRNIMKEDGFVFLS